jgi:hypothetical protein
MSNTTTNSTTAPLAPENGQAGFTVGTGEASGTYNPANDTVLITEPVTTSAPTAGATNPATGRVWTDAEVNTERERIRQEEKGKLYPQIEGVQNELAEMRRLREEEATRAQQEADARTETDRKAREADMSAKDLLAQKEQEWATKFAEYDNKLAQRDALLDQERRLTELTAYRSQVMSVRGDNIIPQLRDFVTGNTPEEIEASVAQLEARSLSILQEMAAAQPAPPPRGTTATAPPNGPMEAAASTRQLTVEEIKAMSPSEYAQHRAALMAAVSRQGPYGR